MRLVCIIYLQLYNILHPYYLGELLNLYHFFHQNSIEDQSHPEMTHHLELCILHLYNLPGRIFGN